VLSLENSPNSESKEKIIRFFSKNAFGKFSRISFNKKKTEFGEFSKLRCQISKLMFFSKSSNSRVEFGEFSKLKC
jgi:hypothetical protein